MGSLDSGLEWRNMGRWPGHPTRIVTSAGEVMSLFTNNGWLAIIKPFSLVYLLVMQCRDVLCFFKYSYTQSVISFGDIFVKPMNVNTRVGCTDWNSALFIILNGTKEEHLDMLDGGIIQRLLEEKWKTFARRQFLKRLAILALHLLMLSVAIYLRPDDRDQTLLEGRDFQSYTRYGFELGTIAGVLSYIVVQQGGEIKNQGFFSFLKQLAGNPAKTIFLASNLGILACIPFRLMGDVHTEEAILVFSVPGSWFLLMFFAGAIRLTGPFVTMVYSMITGDMLTFGIIYSVVLFGFSQSFYFLYKGFPGVKNTLYSSYPSTWMALFQITLGDYNYAELANTTYPALSKAVFLIFMVLVPILLLNMLIAMMGNTYAHVIEQSEKEWVKQWAKIVVSLERAVNQNDAQQYLQEYSIKLGPGDDPSTEQRGVMVIKSKSKTRAKQRKGALSNWKRVGKVTINELRKRGMTGEQLRRIMWGRASISTPQKISKKKKLAPYESSNPLADFMTDMVPPTEEKPIAASAALGAGFGDALSAALDVMAFTNDLDIAAPTPYSVADNGPPAEDPFLELFLTAEQEAIDAAHLAALAEKAVAAAITEPVPVKAPEPPAVDPVLLEAQATLEQAAALEPSDSDGLGDGPLLGRGSRVKRVRSAHQRAAAQSSDRQLLFRRHQGSDSSSNTSSLDYDLAPASLMRLTSPPQGKPVKPPRSASASQPTKARPRPKTARANRVAPALDVPSRRGASATSAVSPPPPPSPPDPLEPWSTRGITNMNTILAWPQTEDDNSI